jgi:hypothetical protein
MGQKAPGGMERETHIRFQISDIGYLKLIVYDILGREVSVLMDGKMEPGRYEVTFDGSGLASGVYIYRLTAGDHVESKAMLLLR